MPTPSTVLFVCLHGSAKSVIALEHFRRLAEQRGVDVVADSAGLEPDAEIPPRVNQGLLSDGIDVRGRRPRRVTPADVEQASHVVTFACDLGALESRSRTRERWEDVPAVSDGYEPARDVIVARVTRLLDDLPRRS
jgi:arsenate reductase (thioredoxin)